MGDVGNRLGKLREQVGDTLFFRYDNGLVVRTEAFMKRDRARVLPLGGPQDTLLNRLFHAPELVRGKRVFDPFCGSGVLGLMALKLGAAHVDFLDINPRACAFARDNARMNGFAPASFAVHEAALQSFTATRPYDVVLANPPFVPTPRGVDGTLTSAGGPEGNDSIDVLLAQMEALLAPAGEAFIYVFQLVVDGQPLLASRLLEHLPQRDLELTAAQNEPLAFADYCAAYRQCFPGNEPEIERWQAALRGQHGDGLTLQHYVIHAPPRRPGPGAIHIDDDLHGKYGMLPYPAGANQQLALARVMENLVLPL